MIVRPHLWYATTFWNPYTKRSIDKIKAVQRRAARFVLSFYDYHPTADLSGKIQISLQWDSLPHHRAVADLCMLNKLRNNIANIAIPPMLVPSVKFVIIVIITTFNLFILTLSDTNFLPEVSDFGISFHTIWQLDHLLSHFALQPSSRSHPYSGTSTQAQIPGAWFKIMHFFLFSVICCLHCYKIFYYFFSIIVIVILFVVAVLI